MQIRQIDSSKLADYSEIPISFEVTTILQINPISNGLGGLQLVETSCSPYVKDYDLIPGSHPLNWSDQFDLNKWGLFVIVSDDIYVGGAAVALQITGYEKDTAILWDLRVHPHFRNKGVGAQLLEEVIHWVKERRYRKLVVETQNVNVPACKFYSNKGFSLGTIDTHGYSNPSVLHETKLLWYLDI